MTTLHENDDYIVLNYFSDFLITFRSGLCQAEDEVVEPGTAQISFLLSNDLVLTFCSDVLLLFLHVRLPSYYSVFLTQ